MVTLDRIRLTGLLRKTPAQVGVFYLVVHHRYITQRDDRLLRHRPLGVEGPGDVQDEARDVVLAAAADAVHECAGQRSVLRRLHRPRGLVGQSAAAAPDSNARRWLEESSLVTG